MSEIRELRQFHCYKDTYEKIMVWADRAKRRGLIHPKEISFCVFLEQYILALERSKIVIRE